MACTTILVGKKATNNGSTLMARNDDSPSGVFTPKKVVHFTNEGERVYKSVLSSLELTLPSERLSFTCTPNIDMKEGYWSASGINSCNVAMTATETITSNPLVLGADPLLKDPGTGKCSGLGEEDLLMVVLPFIHSAKEGVLRLGKLLEEYGTYESNGIAFSDKDEIWYLETIGGHHWMAIRVKDENYVIMPNQTGIDNFSFDDKDNYLCSADLKDFIEKYHLDCNNDGTFNPRLAFSSHSDSDHVYNTPRAYYALKYFNPSSFLPGGRLSTMTAQSDNLPFSLKPERKITVQDVKYILSSHYQGTPYDCYLKWGDTKEAGRYRPIGISRTSDMSILEIRNTDERIAALQWLSFGSNVFNCSVPIYTKGEKIPAYYADTTERVTSENFYWAMRIIGALADSHYQITQIHIERFQNAVFNRAYALLNQFDEKILNGELSYDEANQILADMVKKETEKCLNAILYQVSCHMKNSYSRSDN